MRKRKLAIFDIDGTLFRSSLLIELVDELVSRGVFPLRAKKELQKDYVAWLDRRSDYNNYMVGVVKVYQRYVRGVSPVEVKRAVAVLVKNKKDRTYRYTRGLITELKKKGFYLIALSLSPAEIVHAYATRMGFDVAQGLYYETVDGVYTGKKDRLYEKNKATSLEQLLREFPFEADLIKSVAVGDSESDIPIMKMVGKPIAFNPSRGLAKEAQRQGWRIVVERKDTVYDVKNFSFGL